MLAECKYLHCSCLANPMDGGVWYAAVHGVSKSRTQLSDFPFTFLFHPLEKEMATHSSVLAWRIPGTGNRGGLPSMGSHRVRHNWSDLAATAYIYQVIKLHETNILLYVNYISIKKKKVAAEGQGLLASWRGWGFEKQHPRRRSGSTGHSGGLQRGGWGRAPTGLGVTLEFSWCWWCRAAPNSWRLSGWRPKAKTDVSKWSKSQV